MITPKLDGTRVVFGPCRLSYTHLFSKYSQDGNPENGKYQTNVLIPKSEKETVKAIREAIENAKDEAIASKWSGKLPKNMDEMPLHDGDEKRPDDEIYSGSYYINAKCSTRPGIIDKEKNPIVSEEDVYSGMWAIVSVSFYGYNFGGKHGIGCGLNNVMKTKDDDHLGGRMSAEADFAGIDLEDEDDDL